MNIIYQGKFHNGVAIIQRENGLYSFIDSSGKLLLPNKWFYWVDNFINGFARIQREEDGLYNFINTNGDVLCPNMWFEYVYTFESPLVRVKHPYKGWNYINGKGRLIFSSPWLKWADNFYNGFARVRRKEDGLYNIINTNGSIISPNIWFKYIYRMDRYDILITENNQKYFSCKTAKKIHKLLL